MISFCIDGPNGVGKSTVIQLVAAKCRLRQLRVVVLTDTAVREAVTRENTSYPYARKMLRHQLMEPHSDLYFQERGPLSHLVFDHLANGYESTACCVPDKQINFTVKMALIATETVVEQRLRRRNTSALVLPLAVQIALFSHAAAIQGWPIFRNDRPDDLGRIVRHAVETIHTKRSLRI